MSGVPSSCAMVAAICPSAASRSLRPSSSRARQSFSFASASSRFLSASARVAWRTRDSRPAVKSSMRESIRLKLLARKANSPLPLNPTRAPSAPVSACCIPPTSAATGRATRRSRKKASASEMKAIERTRKIASMVRSPRFRLAASASDTSTCAAPMTLPARWSGLATRQMSAPSGPGSRVLRLPSLASCLACPALSAGGTSAPRVVSTTSGRSPFRRKRSIATTSRLPSTMAVSL